MTDWTDKRPMSPHVQVWRWHATMLGSILHRATGCALYAGAFLVAAWLFAAASGPETYDQFSTLAGSIVGQIVLFGFTVAALYHAINGARHLIWDAGHGFTPKLASVVSTVILLTSVIGAVAAWLLLGLVPGVDLMGAG
jgi:succinate dehydrogenase / fumarate reductase, cytochrome b subunit